MIEAAAFFGVKDFKGATRRHNNKLRKTLSGYGQDVPPARPSTRHTPKADPIPYANKERERSVQGVTNWLSIEQLNAECLDLQLIRH